MGKVGKWEVWDWSGVCGMCGSLRFGFLMSFLDVFGGFGQLL